ncbi:MAG: iron-sulfur cluster-binding protein [Anaerolineae bacterium]|nr:iron-sulfur cluster-binding protein [Anaerolineae bacterium]
MQKVPNQFRESAKEALQDRDLKTALNRGTGNANNNRITAMAELPDAYALRQQGRAARLRALHELPEMLERLEANITNRGGNVLWALDAAEARRHVVEICRKHNVRTAVKSKSMVTEEIELLPALAEAGIEMVETDLGEYIVQIGDDHPSHVVMPIMHMTKEHVREIMMERIGMPYTEDAADMTAYARKTLRENYLKADLGMSGGNFLIAETGTLVVVTNEGNGRLTTSVPPIHVAVVGIEKVIPTWEDFATLIQLLPRSATGQRMAVYTNCFQGPAPATDPDGPEHFYLILVDNGRSNIYASEYAEALACIRCGACLNTCPVYQQVGGHAYGSVYSGPIGSIVTPLLKGIDNASPLPFASSLCGACKDACPVDINIPDMLLKLRHDLQHTQEPYWQVGLKGYAFAFSHPLLYQTGGKLASIATRALASTTANDKINALPYPLSGWTDTRDFPPFASQSFHDWWREKHAADSDSDQL